MEVYLHLLFCASSYNSCSYCGGNCSSKCYEDGSAAPTVSNTCQSNYCASGCSGPGLICGGTSRTSGPTGCSGMCGITCTSGCYRGSNCTGLATTIIFYSIITFILINRIGRI